ncbi:Alpha/Beta hydrolase protein [Suillus paluster]|uniref:Alpha/Beta hydrolase protein n=1 Tax=Suillus paluster TaxID=48578 RepID=UPI001B87B5B0|nr:Alpha/Beta hydrolase protein [Suillus paluster]KAG1732246.1 Alpha/Beta hydrolase protein [Suillus paluster]
MSLAAVPALCPVIVPDILLNQMFHAAKSDPAHIYNALCMKLEMSIQANLLALSQALLALEAFSPPATTTSDAPIITFYYAHSVPGISRYSDKHHQLSWNTHLYEEKAVSQSEDCLFLNVYTPGSEVVATPSGGLPVVVWIHVHGGGCVLGVANAYNGADLIVELDHRGVTVVLQYRLGLFGFLSGEAVKEGGVLNARLPLFTTLVVSGAGSVLQHFVVHEGNTQPPLSRSAMTSSAFFLSQYNYNDRISEVVDGTNSIRVLSLVCALQTSQTLNYNININGFFGTYVFVPVIYGAFIVERPTVTIRKGRLNSTHYLLAVTNSYEGTFVNQSTTLDIADYVKTLSPNFGSAQAAGVMMMYQNQGSNNNQVYLVMSESIFICPTYYLKAFGERVWKAEFSIPPGVHGQDVAYYFTLSVDAMG